MIKQWKDEVTEMRWDAFNWDQIVPEPKAIIMRPLKLRIYRKNDNTVALLANSMSVGAAGKPELANPPVPAVDLGTMGTELTTRITDETLAKEAWIMKRSLRRAKSAETRMAVRRYAGFAHVQFAGDPVKLGELGLGVMDSPALLGTLPAPANLRSRPGQLDQSVDLLWNAVRGREGHELECAESANGPWQQVYRGRKTRATCGNLVSGKEYFFRVRAWGASGPGTWSDITHTRAS